MKSRPTIAVKRHVMWWHNQPPSSAPIGIMTVKRIRARPLSSTGRCRTVSTKMGISAIAMIRAAPTSRLTSEVAINGSRLKSDSSTTGQRTLRSTTIKAMKKSSARTSARGLFCGFDAWDAVKPSEVPCCARPRPRQVSARPSKRAPNQSVPSCKRIPLGMKRWVAIMRPSTRGIFR